MRLAVFGDIHGNLSALEAALADLRQHGADALLCLGDVAMGGPQPAECLWRVRDLGCPVVRGNADRELLEAPFALAPRGFPDEQAIHDIGQWSAAQLDDAEREIVRGFGATAEFPDLLAFHGSPARDNEVLDAATPAEGLAALRTVHGRQAVWVGGHTHKPLLRTLDGWTLLNPGSVGLPFEQRGDHYVNLARAEYLLLDKGVGGWQATFRRVPYDVEAVRRAVLASGMPHAGWAAAEWVAAS